MNVSVIIAAHNAADTIAETLQSLLDQTFPHWEAIVVDDGSSDGTENVVKSFVERDARFRFLRQQQMGVSAARNNGIKLARFDWLVFLDSDDLILPRHLERLTGLLDTDPSLDAAYCGWAYITPDGEQVFEEFYGRVGDLFIDHAKWCISAIHSYIVRQSLVKAVGGFDPSMRTCEDWDLWQRIARTGARFGGCGEILAVYRMRPGSATCNGHQLLKDGIRVLNQGCAPDSRVSQRHPVYPDGLPKGQLAKNRFDLLSACAGYVIGSGNDACPLLEELENERCSTLNPLEVADCIFKHAMVSASRPRKEWYKLWTSLNGKVEDFLVALEAHSGAPRLSRRAGWFAKHLMNRHAKDPDLTRRAGTVMAHLILEIHNLTHRAYESGQFLKRSILVALLMMPKVKRHLQKIKSFLQINEKVKISSENVTLQAHYLTLEDSPSCLNAPNIVKIVKPGPSHQKVVAQSLGNTMDKIPILRYCHVGPASSKNLGNSQVTPKAFEDQLCYMREAGYQGIGLEEWRNAVYKKIPLESQSVLLTFDDGCRDFLTYAWPLLKHYGFTATVFLITSQIGQSKIWDQICGDEISLLSWKEIRQLQSEGVTFGSRSVSHPDLTSLPLKEALREIRQSRIILQNELGIHISSFAYPYGKFNRVIEYLVGVRGYDFGLSCEPGLCTVNHSFLALPRIELKGSDSLEKFVAKLGSLPPSKKGLEMSSVTNFT